MVDFAVAVERKFCTKNVDGVRLRHSITLLNRDGDVVARSRAGRAVTPRPSAFPIAESVVPSAFYGTYIAAALAHRDQRLSPFGQCLFGSRAIRHRSVTGRRDRLLRL